MQYHFKDVDGDGDPDEIIFVKKEEVFSLNFYTEEFKTIHKFKAEIRQMLVDIDKEGTATVSFFKNFRISSIILVLDPNGWERALSF